VKIHWHSYLPHFLHHVNIHVHCFTKLRFSKVKNPHLFYAKAQQMRTVRLIQFKEIYSLNITEDGQPFLKK